MPCGDCSTDDLCRCGPGETCGHCYESKPKENCIHENGCRYLLTKGCRSGCLVAADELAKEAAEPPPPQPEGRAPIAIRYSVQGHLYEVALSADAIVTAVDGALIIQHALGPIAGITQVLPVAGEER